MSNFLLIFLQITLYKIANVSNVASVIIILVFLKLLIMIVVASGAFAEGVGL
jgi:hypothetical protein